MNTNRKWLDLFLAAVFVVASIAVISTVKDLKTTVSDLKEETADNRLGPACVIKLLQHHREGSYSSDQQIAEALGFEIVPPRTWDGIPVPELTGEEFQSLCNDFIKEELPDALAAALAADD